MKGKDIFIRFLIFLSNMKIKIQTVRNSISFYRKQLESLAPKDSLTRHRRSKIDELMNEYTWNFIFLLLLFNGKKSQLFVNLVKSTKCSAV